MIYDQTDIVTLSRQELYEKVWTTPTIKLAESFGLSDVALAKICKKHNIPKPPLGYWARVAAGKKVQQKPLPVWASDNPSRVPGESRDVSGTFAGDTDKSGYCSSRLGM